MRAWLTVPYQHGSAAGTSRSRATSCIPSYTGEGTGQSAERIAMHDTATEPQGGAALRRAMTFVAACRAAAPLAEYPHVGDLQWWARTGALDDPMDWRFWPGPDEHDLAVGLIEGESVVALVHPSARGRGLEEEVH